VLTEHSNPLVPAPSKIVPRRAISARGAKPRLFQDLNYQVLGQALGISPTYVGRIMNGHNKPSMAVAERLAALMGWTLDQVALLYQARKKTKTKSEPEVENAKSRNRRKRKPGSKPAWKRVG